MNFAQTEIYLLSLGNEVATMKLGLDNIRKLLAALGDPETNYLKVQVAGTNGKGSVCAFLDSICRAAGIEVGVFTSPHLVSITERVRINGIDIADEEFARIATLVRETSENLVSQCELETVPTFFEQVTAIALVAFAEAKVELAILETGLGGRYDATTAANAEIAAITRIDLDHQEYLGDTIEEIAAEKSAIITSQSQQVILGAQAQEVMRLLRKHCQELGVVPLNDEYEPWRVLGIDDGTVKVILTLYQLPLITLGLQGRHQIENAQTAVQIAKALWYEGLLMRFEDSEEEFRILEGLKNARHPGRLEYQGRYLFDGAHNTSGANALADFIRDYQRRPITLVFAAMDDKKAAEMLAALISSTDHLVLTQANNSRSIKVEELLQTIPPGALLNRVHAVEDLSEALVLASSITPQDGIIVITGSLYLVGEAKRILKSQI